MLLDISIWIIEKIIKDYKKIKNFVHGIDKDIIKKKLYYYNKPMDIEKLSDI